MKKILSLLLVFILCFSTISPALASGWGSAFGDAFKDFGSMFGSEESSEVTEEAEEAEEEKKEEKSWLQNLGTIAGGLFSEDVGIPKEIHYGDYELFKQDIDLLEAFFQSYVEFMKSYDADDLSMFTEYTAFLASYVEAMGILESLDESKMSSKEERYYLNTLNRINKLLLEAALELQ